MTSRSDSVPLHDYFTNLFKRDVNYEKDNPEYRTVCGKFHVLNLAKFFVMLEIKELLAVLVVAIIRRLRIFDGFKMPKELAIFASFTPPEWMHIVHYIVVVLVVVIAVGTMYSLKREKPELLWPVIIFTAVQCFFIAMLAVVAGFLFVKNMHNMEAPRPQFMVIAFLIVCLLLLISLILLWKISIFVTTKKYLKSLGEAPETNELDVQKEGISSKNELPDESHRFV